MIEDPVAVVKAAYGAFARGDVPTVMRLIDPKAEWVETVAKGLPGAGTHVGPVAVAENVFASVPQLSGGVRHYAGRFLQ